MKIGLLLCRTDFNIGYCIGTVKWRSKTLLHCSFILALLTNDTNSLLNHFSDYRFNLVHSVIYNRVYWDCALTEVWILAKELLGIFRLHDSGK